MISPVLPVYKRKDINFERGEGCYLYTAEGKRYLDFVVGIAVCAFGHANPRLIKTLTEQANKVWIVSNMFTSQLQVEVAEKLKKITFADTAFFTNSGAEAWECAVKIIRRHFYSKGMPERNRIIVCKGLFHGRTMSAISAAQTPKMCDGFAPLLDGFDQVPFNDLDALEKAITPQTAAIAFEPIQGEGGIMPATLEFMQKARALCDKHGLLLMLDEIQCGMGRTGKIWAYEHAGITPDVMCIAKGFGGGFPVGACVATEHAASGMTIGSHGTTYGGNALAMAVASEMIDMVTEPHVLPHVNEVSAYAFERFNALQQQFPTLIKGVRGKGLMIGLHLSEEYADLQRLFLDHGLIAVGAGTDVLRMVPPLNITKAHIDEAFDIAQKACKDRENERSRSALPA